MICIDFSRAEAAIDWVPSFSVPTVILGCGPEKLWVPRLCKVIKNPRRKTFIPCPHSALGPTEPLSITDGNFTALTYPDTRRGTALVVKFNLSRLRFDWAALSLEILSVSEPLTLIWFGTKVPMVVGGTPVKMTVKGLDGAYPEVTWKGYKVPSTRFERLDLD